MICTAKDGEFVTDILEITDSTSTAVLMQLTRYRLSVGDGNCMTEVITESDCVNLPFNLNSRVLACKQIDGLADPSAFYNKAGFVFLILL